MPQQQPQTQQLDPDAVSLAKAIRQTESGGNFTAKGKSGEYGAYQFTEPTWAKDSSLAGLNVPLAQATPEQQNEVAYKRIKAWKDAGYNVGQISSMWNAGEGEPDAYTGKFSNGQPSSGKNKLGVDFNVPAYAKSVATAYHTLKSGGMVGADPNNPSSIAAPQAQDNSVGILPNFNMIGDDLAKNLSDRIIGAGNAVKTTVGGGTGLVSGPLQLAGNIAGAAGDLVGAGLEAIPGVQAVEHGLGSLLGKFADTPGGRQVIGQMKQFATAHPELSSDIGAIVNIASAFPLFKGLGLAKAGVSDAAFTALHGSMQDAAEAELRGLVTKDSVAGRIAAAEGRGVKPVQRILSSPELIPSIVESEGKMKYSTEAGQKLLQNMVDEDEVKLGNLLKTPENAPNGTGYLASIDDTEKRTLEDIKKAYELSGGYSDATSAVKEYFNTIRESDPLGRNYISLFEKNQIKRDIGKRVFAKLHPTEAAEIKRYMYGSLRRQIEEEAAKAGVQGVDTLGKRMSENITAKDLLEHIDGKALKAIKKGGLAREFIQGISGGLAEIAATSLPLPIPYASTLAGRGLGSLIGRGGGTANTALSRLARKQTNKGIGKQIAYKLSQGLVAQSLVKKQPQ